VWCGDGPAHCLLAHPGECAWKCRSNGIPPPWSLNLETHTPNHLDSYCAVVGAKPKGLATYVFCHHFGSAHIDFWSSAAHFITLWPVSVIRRRGAAPSWSAPGCHGSRADCPARDSGFGRPDWLVTSRALCGYHFVPPKPPVLQECVRGRTPSQVNVPAGRLFTPSPRILSLTISSVLAGNPTPTPTRYTPARHLVKETSDEASRPQTV